LEERGVHRLQGTGCSRQPVARSHGL
jgi:hypothetical protein